LGQELGQTANELIRRGINVAPTLEIRPGYPFNVMVTQDLVFPGPYAETGRP
jgi:type IV secretion system protein TrbI